MGTRQRLYPTPEQSALLDEFCAHERFLYNLAVEQYEFARTYRGRRSGGRQSWPNAKTRSAELTELRKELPWLALGSLKVQQQALRIVDRAYKNWRANPTHFRRPTFRSRGGWQGITLVGAGTDYDIRRINRRWCEIRVPKCATRIRFRLSVTWSQIADTRSCRITRDPAGRWFVSFPGPQPAFERQTTGSVVGIDRGIANTIATSNADMGHMPGLSAKEAERWLRLERRLTRQHKGSNRRNQTRLQLARMRQRLNDRLTDWIEQTTTALVREHDVIVLEKLRVTNMTRSARGTITEPGRNVSQKTGLNRAITAQRWAEFADRLNDKANATPEHARCTVLTVAANHTSQRCRICDHTTPDNRKSQAVFECQSCGHTGHADTEAAINIRERGMGHWPERSTARGHRVAGRRDPGTPESTKRQPPPKVA
jgi:putative transposase